MLNVTLLAKSHHKPLYQRTTITDLPKIIHSLFLQREKENWFPMADVEQENTQLKILQQANILGVFLFTSCSIMKSIPKYYNLFAKNVMYFFVAKCTI